MQLIRKSLLLAILAVPVTATAVPFTCNSTGTQRYKHEPIRCAIPVVVTGAWPKSASWSGGAVVITTAVPSTSSGSTTIGHVRGCWEQENWADDDFLAVSHNSANLDSWARSCAPEWNGSGLWDGINALLTHHTKPTVSIEKCFEQLPKEVVLKINRASNNKRPGQPWELRGRMEGSIDLTKTQGCNIVPLVNVK